MEQPLICEGVIGFTDGGAPIVSSEHSCEHGVFGKLPPLGTQTCWYCRHADFRKTTDRVLRHSVCRCEHNRVTILAGHKNESKQHEGEARK